MKKTIFEDMFKKSYENKADCANIYRKNEEYYKVVDPYSEKYLIAKLGRIHFESEAKIDGLLKDYPLLLEARYASEAKLEKYREELIEKIKNDIDETRTSLYFDRDQLSSLESKERELIDLHSKGRDKTNEGIELNSNIEKVNETIMHKEYLEESLKEQLEEIKSLSTEELRERMIKSIPSIDSLLQIEKDIMNNRDAYKVYYNVANNPIKVMELLDFLPELNKLVNKSKPKPVLLDDNKYSNIKEYDKESLPEEIIDNVFNNSNIYNNSTLELEDPKAALKAVNEYYKKFIEELKKFRHIMRFERLFELRHLVDYENVSKDNNSDEFENALEYFKEDQRDYIDVNYDIVNTQDFNALKALLVKLNLLNKKLFKRKQIEEIRKSIADTQIDLYEQVYSFYDQTLKSFNVIPVSKNIKFFVDPDKSKNIDEFNKIINTELDELDAIESNILCFISLLTRKCIEKNKNQEKYQEEILSVVKNILDLSGIDYDSESIKDFDYNYLVSNKSGDEMLEEIYNRAAMVFSSFGMDNAKELAIELSFEEEAKLRDMSYPELYRRKLKELEKAKVLKIEHKEEKKQD